MEGRLKIATIMDEPCYTCFKHECDLIKLDIDSWKSALEREKPDLLFVESGWITTISLIYQNNVHAGTLRNIVDWCKRYDTPTAFWYNEDPSHFGLFVDSARLFQYFFTTDAGNIQRYKNILRHSKVYYLPYGVQPKIHNPINRNKGKLGKVAYAGPWYKPYPEAVDDLRMLIKSALKYDLHIYNMVLDYDKSSVFPLMYEPIIRGQTAYTQLSSLYKQYDIFLNVDLSKISPTAFPMRVYELLACGSNVISSYSPAIENMLPGLVKQCKTEQDANEWLEILTHDKGLRDRLSVLGQREVFKNHTYKHRLGTIAEITGLKYNKVRLPSVSIITCTNKEIYMDNVFDNYSRQNYEDKELIIILNNNKMNIDEWEKKSKQYENVSIFQLDESKTLGECLNFAVDRSNRDYVSKFDDDDYYSPEYLIDTINAFMFSDAGVVGRYTYYAYFKAKKILAVRSGELEDCYTRSVAGGTITVKKEVFDRVRFPHISLGEDTGFFKQCTENGIKIYSTNRFNYVYTRNPSKGENTWKAPDDELLKRLNIIAHTDNYVPYIQV